MLGNRVTAIWRKLTMPSSVRIDEDDGGGDRPADRPGGNIEPHGAAPSARGGNGAHAVAGAQERGGARDDRLARIDAAGDLERVALGDAERDAPLLDDSVAHHQRPRARRVARHRARRHADAPAARERDLGRGEAADMGAARPRRSATRTLPVRLDLSTSAPISRTVPATLSATPGRASSALMPTARRGSACSGASASRSIAPSLMMRNSGSPAPPTAAPSRAVRRLTTPPTGAFTSVCANLT